MAPGYASLSSVASHALGCSVTSWTAESGGVSFSVERLRSLLRPESRLVVVNVPHNPTGWLPTPAEWAQLIALCDERGLYLFSDEMYRHLERPALAATHPTLPSAAESYPECVS